MASELWAWRKPPVQTQAIVISSGVQLDGAALLSLLDKATEVIETTGPRCCLPDEDDNPIYTLPNNKKRRRLPPRTTAVQPVRESCWQQPCAGLVPL
jgi:hypothetical protein